MLLHKNLPDADRKKALFRRLLDTIAWAKSIATLNFADAGAILKAHRDYRKMAPAAKTSNATVNLLKDRPNILLAYFLRRHLKFSSL